MIKTEAMPMLSDILKLIDRNKVLSDRKNKYNHSVTYNTSRTILKYIQENTRLTAYAYNPGNAVVIFPKKQGLSHIAVSLMVSLMEKAISASTGVR